MRSLESFYRRFSTEGPKNSRERLLFWLLIPVSLAYGVVAWLRGSCYRWGLLPREASRLPVISVGNLAVGGTGKTPFVDYLLGEFSARGLRAAVISRGYGGAFSEPMLVVSAAAGPLVRPEQCGDEPYLLASRHPEAVVIVAPRRKVAIRWLNERDVADVIILDDAFQHRQVRRDLDIVLLDAKKPFGNGFPMPGGRLREFPFALRRADLLVLTRAVDGIPAGQSWPQPTLSCFYRLSSEFFSLAGETLPAAALAGQRGVAFAGIATPESFFRALRELGLELVETYALPDHESYSARTLQRLAHAAGDADYFVTTEKDAVKIAAADLPRTCYISQLQIEISDAAQLKVRLEALFPELER